MNKEFNIFNRKASFDYNILKKEIAGIQLIGTEVKAIKSGRVSLVDSYCFFDNGELFIRGLNIQKNESHFEHDPLRDRKLLMKKAELKKINKSLSAGLTIIPLKLFSNKNGIIKVEIAIASGKKNYDKRESIKEKDIKMDLKRSEEIKI